MPESGSVDSVLVLKTGEADPPVPPAEPVVTNTVTYLGLEGAVNTNVTVFTTNDLPLTLGPVVREGYAFLGWTPDGGVIPAGTVTNVTFTANWEKLEEPPATYAIAYDLAGGVNAAGNPASYTTNDLPIALAAPTREGYEFAGWTPFGEIPAGTTGDLKITATWKEVPVPPAVSLVVPFEDGEELAKGEQIDGADHLIVVNDVVEPKITVKGLPSGLKFDAKSSWIAGKPSKSGVYTLTVTVTDKKNKGMQPLVETRRLIVRGDGEHVVVASCDAAKGTVKGQGVYASGKKVTLKATAGKGYAFAGWSEGEEYVSGLASYAFTMSDDDRSYQAMFVTVDEDRAAVSAHIDALGVDFAADVKRAEASVLAGVYLEWPVAVEALSDVTVKVSGLPSGLKFAAKDVMVKGSKTAIAIPANTIYGTPKAASKPGKPSLVKVSVTTAGKTKQEFVLELTVNALPTWAVGMFNGGSEFGQVALTVGKDGKLSGKWLNGGNTWTLSAPGFDGFLEETDETSEVLFAVLQAKSGKTVLDVLVLIQPDGAAGYYGDEFDTFLFEAGIADWKSEELKTTGAKIAKSDALVCTIGGSQPGEVLLTFGARGTVKVTGVFQTGEKNGKPVYAKATGSAVLCPNGEVDGCQIFRLYIYLPAKGAFDGYAEVFDLPWDGTKFVLEGE